MNFQASPLMNLLFATKKTYETHWPLKLASFHEECHWESWDKSEKTSEKVHMCSGEIQIRVKGEGIVKYSLAYFRRFRCGIHTSCS